ncbi:MAG: methylenetetrahydrofolate reductase [Actinomycetota bacterium]|nr:methylenetetrahydrofolate reductase [Actinomycetota bacterium]
MSTSHMFEILCEIEPPTTPDLGVVREQIALLQGRCDAFLVPDSHLGRATVSSIAVAHEVAYLQGRAVACLNARDRNLLGLRRDLLTAHAYGVKELLLVYGDKPSVGERAPMNVRTMLDEVRQFAPDLRVGVAADVNKPFPNWKRAADFLCTQLSFDASAVAAWRQTTAYDGQVYAGVIALASDKMALRLAERIPGFKIPGFLLDRLRNDPNAGVEAAVATIGELKAAHVVDGVHLVPGRRYREVAAALDEVEV